MSYSKAQNKATQKYQKENYDRINLTMPKGKRDYYKSEAKKLGYDSVNKFIISAMDEKIERG